MIVVVEDQEARAGQRAAGQVERPPRLLDRQPACLGLAGGPVERPEVGLGATSTQSDRPRPGPAGRRRCRRWSRSVPCRRTISAKQRRRIPRSSGPQTRPASVMLYVAWPGDELVEEPEALLRERGRDRAVRLDRDQGGGDAALGAHRVPRSDGRDAGDVRIVEKLAERQVNPQGVAGFAMSPGWPAASGRPGRRSCRTRRHGPTPSTSAQIPAISSSIGVRGGTKATASRRSIAIGGRQRARGRSCRWASAAARRGSRTPRGPCTRGDVARSCARRSAADGGDAIRRDRHRRPAGNRRRRDRGPRPPPRGRRGVPTGPPRSRPSSMRKPRIFT